MNIEHFQKINPDFSAVTIQTAEISCPFCHQHIRMVVPDDCKIHEYRDEAMFLRSQNDELRRALWKASEIQRELLARIR